MLHVSAVPKYRLSRLAAAVVACSLYAVSLAQVTFVDGSLTIVTGAADDQFKVIVGPVNGRVALFGVPGTPDGTFFNGVQKITMRTNAGYDKIEVETYSTVLPNININTGTGLSEVWYNAQVPIHNGRTISRLTLTGNSADDKFFGTVYSRARDVRLVWNVNARGGNNEAHVLLESPYATNTIDLQVGYQSEFGDDKLLVESNTFAPKITALLNATMGDGNDELVQKIISLQPADIQSNMNVNLGEGSWNHGIFEFVGQNSNLTLSGQVSGGNGEETFEVKAEMNVNTSLVLNGAGGNDIMLYDIKQSMWGSPQLLGGHGNDHMSFLVEGGRFGNPFVDGGPGYDIFVGWATTIINVEEIS